MQVLATKIKPDSTPFLNNRLRMSGLASELKQRLAVALDLIGEL